MKKLTFMFLMVFFTATIAQAQFEIKALIGTNFAGMSGHDFSEVKANAGYQFGGGVLIGDKFYVEPGIMFGKKSSTISENSTNVDFDQNFVRIPVYAGYHILGHESGPLALRLFAGPTVTIPGSVKSGDENNIFKDDNIKGAMWGLDGGLGVDIFFLFVELNYEHSFSDHFVDGTEGKHNSVYINAGIHIDF